MMAKSIAVAIPFFTAGIALADSGALVQNSGDLVLIFCRILGVMFWAAIAVSVVMALWAAFEYVTANGDEEKIMKAKKALFYAACGVIAALLAYGFPDLVASVFGQTYQNCTVVSSSIIM